MRSCAMDRISRNFTIGKKKWSIYQVNTCTKILTWMWCSFIWLKYIYLPYVTATFSTTFLSSTWPSKRLFDESNVPSYRKASEDRVSVIMEFSCWHEDRMVVQRMWAPVLNNKWAIIYLVRPKLVTYILANELWSWIYIYPKWIFYCKGPHKFS